MATRPIVKPLADDILYWNNLIYGDPGCGKTVFAGSDLRVLYVVPEKDGLMSAKTMGSKAQRIICHSWEDLKNTYEWFDENPDELQDYDVMSIDSASEMQHLAKNYVLRMGADEKLRKGRDPDKMEIQDYGEMHNIMEMMVRGYNDLPINVLYTCTAKMVEGPDKEPFLVPDLQGKKEYGIAMKIASLMTSYGYMRVETHDVPDTSDPDGKKLKKVRRRVIYWEDTGTIRGKDRTNALKPFTINMNLQQMRRAIRPGDIVRRSDGFMVKKVAQPATAAPKKATKPVIQKAEEQASPKDSDKVESVVQQDQSVAENAVAEAKEKESQAIVERIELEAKVVAAAQEKDEKEKNGEKADMNLEDAVEA